MSGEDRVHPQAAQQPGDAPGPVRGPDGLDGRGQGFADRLAAGVPLPERADPLMLFGQVSQVEIDGERVRDGLGPLQRPGGDHLGDLIESTAAPGSRGTGSGGTGGDGGRGQPGVDDRAPQPFHVVQQALAAGFAEHLAEQVAEQAYVPAHRRRHVLAVGVPAHHASVATAAAGTRQRRPLTCGRMSPGPSGSRLARRLWPRPPRPPPHARPC